MITLQCRDANGRWQDASTLPRAHATSVMVDRGPEWRAVDARTKEPVDLFGSRAA